MTQLEEIKVPETNNTSNNQKDSQQELNNSNLGKIQGKEYYWSKNNFQSNAAKENITTEKGQWLNNTVFFWYNG